MNCSYCIWMRASQCCQWTSFTWSEHWMFMHGRLVLHSHVSQALLHTLSWHKKCWFLSTLPWHLNFSHVIIPWPKTIWHVSILNWVLNCMGSQWSEAKMGEICSNLRMPVRRRALFWPAALNDKNLIWPPPWSGCLAWGPHPFLHLS